jgi:hypothetical protein
MIGVAFDSDEFFILYVINHGASIWAVMWATAMICLD